MAAGRFNLHHRPEDRISTRGRNSVPRCELSPKRGFNPRAPLTREVGSSSKNPPAVKPLTLHRCLVRAFQSSEQPPPVPEIASGLYHVLHSLCVEQDHVAKVGGARAPLG